MSERRLFPILFICCVSVNIVIGNDLASCYSQPAESCPVQNKCKCVKTDESSLFCCQVQSNEDLLKQFECSAGMHFVIKMLINNSVCIYITYIFIYDIIEYIDQEHNIMCKDEIITISLTLYFYSSYYIFIWIL